MNSIKHITHVFLFITGILFLCSDLYSQVIKSEKASIFVGSQPDSRVSPDKTAPVLELLSHELKNGEILHHQSSLSLIGKVTDESGISYMAINSNLVPTSEEGIFVKEFDLLKGRNEFSIVAVDQNNNILRESFIVNFVPEELTLAGKLEGKTKYYGLIIGIDNYVDPLITDLDNPVRDAESIYNTLVNNYTFEEENITFLKDGTYREIVLAFDELAEKITPEDNLLIFYAGHGWWDQDANNGFWLPSDASNDNKSFWFRNSTLVDYLKEVKSKHTLLIADACFGGAIFKTRSAFNAAPKAIEMLYELQSRKAMTSGTLTEVPDRSAFIEYLVQRLKENEEKYLSSEQLFSSFRIAVINNSDAIPQYGEIKNVGDQGGDFIFIRK